MVNEAATLKVWDNYTFDLAKGLVLVDGLLVHTTTKEFALALFLFGNLSRPLSRGQIVEAVWGTGASPTSRALDAHVSPVRKRLNLTPNGGFPLSSVYGYGYRLDSLNKWHNVPLVGVTDEPVKIACNTKSPAMLKQGPKRSS